MSRPPVLLHSFFLFIALFIYGKSYSEPQNLSLLKQEIIQYHDQGQYEHEIQQVSQQAQHFMKQQIKQHPHKKYALVLDIDETCLSNYQNIVATDFTSDSKTIHHNILKGNATVIKPTLKLYDYAKQHGIAVFMLSGRLENERQATIHNLHQAGFHGWKKLYLQSNSKPHQMSNIESFKIATRKFISQQGYTIIASIGDQPVDLNGGYALKTFKYPNPFYYIPSSIH